MVGIPRGFEFLISVAGEKNLRVVPKQAPVAVRLRPKENLPPDEAVVRIDAGIRLGAVAADAEDLLRAEDVFCRGNKVFQNAVGVC